MIARTIAICLLLASSAGAKDKKNPAYYPLTAHVVSINRTGTHNSVYMSDGTFGTVNSSDSTVQFRIGDLFYTGGYGCRKHVQVGTDVHARLEKNKLYILTGDGQTCDTQIRSVQEVSKQAN
jgi:hypothetical protein